ncbi:hypothetical protein [uncultured Zoogloea sp.]|uniref:hypothetical protein n=1 Tax=uncultured Zoogloea sp. TaxID=160237 RepID=UPI00260C70B0|nr:hypothetical protein [uncultured Zoogloea sp.]
MMLTTHHRHPVLPVSTAAPRLSTPSVALLLAIGLAGGYAAIELVLQLYPIH